MPKLRTISSAKKRFKMNSKGQLRHRKSNRSHILTKKGTKRKRNLRGLHNVHEADKAMTKRMLQGS